MAIYSEFSHSKWWFSIAMLVYQRVVEMHLYKWGSIMINIYPLLFSDCDVCMGKILTAPPQSGWLKVPQISTDTTFDESQFCKSWFVCTIKQMIYHDISWYIMIYLILSHKTSQFGWLNPLFLVKSPFVCYLANMHFKHPRIPEAFLWSPKAWQWSSSWKRSSRDLTWDGITQIPLLIE